jgi:hypothetical protein
MMHTGGEDVYLKDPEGKSILLEPNQWRRRTMGISKSAYLG